MRLVFFAPRLALGGAERVLALLANLLHSAGNAITIATTSQADDFYPLAPGIKRVRLATGGHGPLHGIKRLMLIRRVVRKTVPDVVVSFLNRTNVRVLLSTILLKVPVVVTEHSEKEHNRIGPLWEMLRHTTYRRAFRVVSISKGVDAQFSWLARSRRVVFPNPIVNPPLSPLGLAGDGSRARKIILAAGRLVRVKGFDILIDAFSRLSKSWPEWDLVIVGEGEERRALENLAAELGVAHRVLLPGASWDIYAWLMKGTIFCLSSRSEGQGLILLEAMACGLPVVATDCSAAVRGMIRHGENGALVPAENPESLAREIDCLMKDPQARSRQGAAGRKAVEPHRPENVTPLWQSLLIEAADSVMTTDNLRNRSRRIKKGRAQRRKG